MEQGSVMSRAEIGVVVFVLLAAAWDYYTYPR